MFATSESHLKETGMDTKELNELLDERDRSGKPLVLIIEDDESQQALYRVGKSIFGMIPYIVQSCAEGISAAEQIDFDMVIVDLRLPNMNGLECTKKIRKIEKDRGIRTPIIAITADAMPGVSEKCIEAGMDDYLSKPFSLRQLTDKISSWAA
jgi:two-component system, sensor histidine kinase and response regulator